MGSTFGWVSSIKTNQAQLKLLQQTSPSVGEGMTASHVHPQAPFPTPSGEVGPRAATGAPGSPRYPGWTPGLCPLLGPPEPHRHLSPPLVTSPCHLSMCSGPALRCQCHGTKLFLCFTWARGRRAAGWFFNSLCGDFNCTCLDFISLPTWVL